MMDYILKQIPEDFVVVEKSLVLSSEKFDLGNGNYSCFYLKKRNLDMHSAIRKLSFALKMSERRFSYAGVKDKRAVSFQFCSVYGNIDHFSESSPDFSYEVFPVGRIRRPVSLGDLYGNYFAITARNIFEDEISGSFKKGCHVLQKVPNYFGSQRFGIDNNNPVIGKMIVKKKFSEALFEIMKSSRFLNLKGFESPIDAMRKIPLKVLSIYVHSYQSMLFNMTVDRYIRESFPFSEKNKLGFLLDGSSFDDSVIDIPLVGFGLCGEIRKLARKDSKNAEVIDRIIREILEEEEIEADSFAVRQFPELSGESIMRKAFVDVDFLIRDVVPDFLNPGKKAIRFLFFLPKSSYATVAISSIL